MIWNIEHWNAPKDHKAATQWESKVHELLWSLKTSDDSPRYRDFQWRTVFDEQVKKTPLSLLIASDDQLFALPIGEEQIEWQVKLSMEDAWERFATLSQVAVLEGEEREVSLAYVPLIVVREFTDENASACSQGVSGRD